MRGIQECAALPTGLIMYDTRIFALADPKAKQERLSERVVLPFREKIERGDRLTSDDLDTLVRATLAEREEADQSWFYYHYTDEYQTQKSATEDVLNTRDLAFCCLYEHGYNPLRCAWDCWAGHWKVKCVDKPYELTASDVEQKYRRAVARPTPPPLSEVDASDVVAGLV